MQVPLSKMYLDEEIKSKVINVLESGQFVNGPESRQFESEFAARMGAKHAIAVNSGSSALFIALLALGIKPGDEVICPSLTFIASISQAVMLGAIPVFADIDLQTYTLDVNDVRRKCSTKTKAIIAVHLYGHPVDMDSLMDLARAKGIIVIEDCAQSIGTKYKGRIAGTIGEAGCFSFFPSKAMTVDGDGGMIITNNADLAERMAMLKNHGRISKHVIQRVGMNMRMSEIPAAIGRIQLRHLDEFIKARSMIVARYNERLGCNYNILIPNSPKHAEISHYVYTIRIGFRDEFADYMLKNGVQTGIYYPVPLHQQPALSKYCRHALMMTEWACRMIISLPLFASQTIEEADYVIDTALRWRGLQ